jgi:hypothetical protein
MADKWTLHGLALITNVDTLSAYCDQLKIAHRAYFNKLVL